MIGCPPPPPPPPLVQHNKRAIKADIKTNYALHNSVGCVWCVCTVWECGVCVCPESRLNVFRKITAQKEILLGLSDYCSWNEQSTTEIMTLFTNVIL